MKEPTEATLYRVENGAAWITLNRPERRNALSAILLSEVHEHLTCAGGDPDVRAVVITGSGTAFCSGADLKSPPGSLIQGRNSIPYADVLVQMQQCEKPVIAAVNGFAFAGGIGLVAAADIAISVDEAVFSFSEVRLGLVPAVIATVALPKLGEHHAMKLFLTGERFTGSEAKEFGLIHRTVVKDDLEAAVQSEVDQIKLGGPNAVSACKRLVRVLPTWDRTQALDRAAAWSHQMFKTEEGLEGMAAFREKRKPSWVK